jgi:hypothetical protein
MARAQIDSSAEISGIFSADGGGRGFLQFFNQANGQTSGK